MYFRYLLILVTAISIYSEKSFSALYSSEHNLFERFPDYFSKKKNKITVKYFNKKSKTFTDKPKQSDATVKYTLESYNDEDDTVLLKAVGWESVSYTLIELADGTEHQLLGFPVWNESYDKFVTLSYDSQTEDKPSEYQLGFCKDKKCILGPRAKSNYMGARWTADDQIIFTKTAEDQCKLKDTELVCEAKK